MEVTTVPGGFELRLGNRLLLRHSTAEPALFVGRGRGEAAFFRGNFKVHDEELLRVPLRGAEVETGAESTAIFLRAEDSSKPCATLVVDGANDTIRFEIADRRFDRLWLRLVTVPGEATWGAGEQFSHLNLAGRRFPVWTMEPGVGRDMTTRMTTIAEIRGRAGAHETATYYPQPTFISSRDYALHLDTSAYCVLDFTAPLFHELEVWDRSFSALFFEGAGAADLARRLATRFGHSGRLPEWVLHGAIVGLKRGLPRNLEILDKVLEAGVPVSGLWCEDWCGVRQTSFGTRLFWNWEWNESRYPDLPGTIASLWKRGIRFLAYDNPNLCADGALFREAAERGFLVKTPDGGALTVDFGEFDCGFVDLTDPAARSWYKERIVKKNMLDLGISGWMADFGEYLPVEARCASGEDGWAAHNRWPELWARTNAEAIAEAGASDEAFFFMRSGFTGSQKHCSLLWAGDQCVDFSRHDGMETAICAALSAGLVGNALSHSDIGGYTTLYGNARTEEVFLRWAEMASFTPVMRTHEGNRPDESFQFYQSEGALAFFALAVRRYLHLVPYLRTLMDEAVSAGMPAQRPLFLHYQADKATWSVHDEYLYGPDLLVAPVHKGGVERWRPYLPAGETWVHLWSGREYEGGTWVEVRAPIGEIPAFYRAGSRFASLFEALPRISSANYFLDRKNSPS